MATRYYDDVLVEKIKRWIPQDSPLRILKPDETKRLFELKADDKNDKPLKLPVIALSRNNDIELNISVKTPLSYDGLKIHSNKDITVHFNAIPINLTYQLDIYTKTYEEGDEYVRAFLFKLINNPVIKIEIPYNDVNIEHIANIHVLPTVSDTSAISERIFPGQFTRWSIQLEIQDAFLFSIPYKNNWKLVIDEDTNEGIGLEVSNKIDEPGETEHIETTIN